MRMIGTNIIETERCILRKIQLSDYQMMYENWAKYEEVLNGIIRVVPPKYRLKELEKLFDDYDKIPYTTYFISITP
mgnify:CR=1 FL=1